MNKAIRKKIEHPKYLWQTEEEAFIINGYLFKKDRNFVTSFDIDKIGDFDICRFLL
jgi:hypothetical protein